MILNSDLILYHPLWEKADEFLCNKDAIGLFRRLVDVYIIACAIGIKEDKTITKIENPMDNPKTIGRNTYMSMTNIDLKDLLDHMLQNALICSQTIDLDIDERLKLAFDPDYTNSKISAAGLLNGFANYGIEQIFSQIDSSSPLVVIDQLYKYFESLTESNYDDILQSITLEELIKLND